MKSEDYRWEMKLQRLLDRIERVWEELAKSNLSSEKKAELYDSFGSFIAGFCVHLEKQYPELKREN